MTHGFGLPITQVLGIGLVGLAMQGLVPREVGWLGWALALGASVVSFYPGYQRRLLYDELRRLGKLQREGSISQEEFEQMHQVILNGQDPTSEYPPELKEIMRLWQRGHRAREWPLELVGNLMMNPIPEWIVPLSRLVAYYAHLDRRIFDIALIHISEAQRALSSQSWQPPAFTAVIDLEQAFLLSLTESDLDTAHKLIDRASKVVDEKDTVRLRALTAYLLATGRTEEAETSARIARGVIETHGTAGILPTLQAELDWLDWPFENKKPGSAEEPGFSDSPASGT